MKRTSFIILLVLFLAACKGSVSPAEQSMQKYMQALVDKDQNALLSLVCPSYEMDALLEFDSFALIQTTLKDVSCHETGSTASETQVVCKGSIDASYNGEIQSFDLSARTYTVINEKGYWLVCGYTK
jgi:hypothetical protein